MAALRIGTALPPPERAILAPSEGAPTDYDIGGIPGDFATRISPPDLTLLVVFVHRKAAAQ